MAAIILLVSSYQAFLISWWIPVVPSLLALCSSAFTISGYTYINKLQEANTILELVLRKQTKELEGKNGQLENALQELKVALKLPVIQDELALKEVHNKLELDEELLKELDKILFSSINKEL